jgi:hypothetical protein
MAYDVTLAQLNTNISGLSVANTHFGFPQPGNFHTLLMSFWACGPLANAPGTSGYAGIWPEFNSAEFFTFDPGFSNGIKFTNQTLGANNSFYHGIWVVPSPGMRMHFLLSVDTHAQTVQLYINDQRVPVSDAWTGTPPFDFNLGPYPANIWAWDVSAVIGSGRAPALGDAWIANPPAFVDLSVTANRRKFINADLTPVDLGNTGAGPFGTSPNIYMSVRPGGVATDILINRGTGGGTWGYSQNPPTLQDAGACTRPIPPPQPATPKLWLLRVPKVQFIGPGNV